ncbi:hypothetical protein GUJ93_ZPchr0007g5590 [Zizania palustris]|uniref:SBP-type domain-containing protein n=1 Tax=Zizania palustris TaxID=103762 RepID=A0A8J5TG01_ZIZPA|nr:hypothetical protein GUJ93_ZPchr0007g3449 [Zizania palustris]KAG8080454.1 hypothetical protein GUJ93_ZPchr0007g5590 [Zizania palustris]
MNRKDKPRKSSSSATTAAGTMAALAAAADVGDGVGGTAAAPSPMEEDGKTRLAVGSLPVTGGAGAAGAAGASSRSPSAAARRGAGGGGPSCQVERCTANLSEARQYHRRHKVCELHSKQPIVLVAGLRQRFCQQCSRFHEIAEFDDDKRSCRNRLAGHNERRRKSSAEAARPAHGDGCRNADQDGRGHPGPGNPPMNFQIR